MNEFHDCNAADDGAWHHGIVHTLQAREAMIAARREEDAKLNKKK